MPSKSKLGTRIKRFRLDQGLTLKDVEANARVSATHVSEIERGLTSPTVGALAKIARAMGTDPSYFLDTSPVAAVSVVKKNSRRVLTYENWHARIHCLSGGIDNGQMSFLEMEIEPGGMGHTMEPMTGSGEELIHVLKGVTEIQVGADRHLLKEGDSIHFRSTHPHTIRNIGDGMVSIMWVASPAFHL